MEELIEWRGKPKRIRVNNVLEFITEKISAWCKDKNIGLIFIENGTPSHNALIERFNRTYR